ncbi:dehydratase [Blastococcus sp. SYSU D00669]
MEGVLALVGEHLGPSGWVTLSRRRLDAFAAATGSCRELPADPEGSGPGGATVPHLLTLSLVPVLLAEVLDVSGFRLGVNYGTGPVFFPCPAPLGSRVRAQAVLESATEFDGGVQLSVTVTLEVDGAGDAAVIATVLLRRYL